MGVVAGVAVWAQQPTFKTGAELVRVDVTVLDTAGKPVPSLSIEDFTLHEDGIPQKIQTFKFIDLTQPSAGDEVLTGDLARAPSELARDDIRMFLVFWDEYHIPPDMPARKLRDELVQFLRTMVRPVDVVALMDPWTPMSHLRFTRDMERLIAETLSLRGRQGVFVPPRNGAEENQLWGRQRVPFAREQVAATALQSAIMHLGTLREGRKTVLYLGRDFSVGRDAMNLTQDIIRAANDANVALYSINPDGLTMQPRRIGIISDIARNTGGEARLSNSAIDSFRRAATQANAFYLLGYSPEPLRRDSKFHRITVKVGRKGLDVRARNGYWAPSVGDMTRAKKSTSEAGVSQDVEKAFGQLARIPQGADEGPPVRTVTVPSADSGALRLPEPRLWRVRQPTDLRRVLAETPPPPDHEREFARTERLIVRFAAEGSAAATATVTVALVNKLGRRLTELPLKREGTDWMLDLPLSSIARGDYLLAFEAAAGESRATAYVPIRVN